ncbi:tight adherence protein B [Haloactinopolyspora alba]|uniref:Tight adherence protein B n=1 Tax=Haloactinopolyspora alba TaxID=648780 RepID=A0A2P8E7G6_9ACTN|nr:tight adherence protein B [Haloactinopolyspora alba]
MAGALVLGTAAGPGGVVMGAVAAPCTAVWWSRRQRARARHRRETDVDEACLALAGELGAGMAAGSALASVAEDWPELFAAASGRAAVGDDPVPALRTAARLPGAEALSAVAAAWEVAERSGAGPATVLQAVSESLRSLNAVRREAEAQLASVRATTRLMAALPLLTVVVFSGGDGATVDFLTRHPYGLACLVTAGVFIALGVVWVERAARAARPVWPA